MNLLRTLNTVGRVITATRWLFEECSLSLTIELADTPCYSYRFTSRYKAREEEPQAYGLEIHVNYWHTSSRKTYYQRKFQQRKKPDIHG